VFGGDRSVIGRIVRVNSQPFTVVGVTAPGYFGVSNGGFFPPTDVTVPLHAQALVQPRWTPKSGSLFTTEDLFWLRVMARVHPDVDRERLRQRLMPVFLQHLAPARVDELRPEIVLQPGSRGLDSMRASVERPLYVLGGAAVLVFLIACVNLASLILARGIARQQELWIRLALGASRGRLIRQSFTESAILASAGGALGAVLAVWCGRALVAMLSGSASHAIVLRLDLRLIGLTAIVSCVAPLLFGVFPALRLSSQATAAFIRQTGAGAAATRLRAGRVLILAQVAVSVPLLVGAALFLRTVHNLSSIELGFEPRGQILFRMDPTLNGYDEVHVRALFRQILDRLAQLPSVTAVTLEENALVSRLGSSTTITVEGSAPASIMMNRVGPGFFETVGMPLLAGRGFGVQDREGAPRVGVVNEAAVRQFFRGANPIGQRVRITGRDPVDVIGLARNSKYDSLKVEDPPILFLPYFQSTGMGGMTVAVRASLMPGLSDAIRNAVAEVDRDVPVVGMKTQVQQIDETIGSERTFATLLLFFGVFALLLASVGLHGVTAYAVTRRTSEIGIRMALGAQRLDVVWLILRQVMGLAGGGLLIGIPASLVLAQSARPFLYGVRPADPWSLASGGLVLFLIAVLAGFLPARRASRLDPLTALRRE
jgi:predicted permease